MANNHTSIDHLIKTKKETSLPKEVEPISTKESFEIKETIEHEPSEELQPYVEKRKENIKLPMDVEKIGVTTTQTTQFPTYQSITTPLSDDKVIIGLHAPITSSFRWLAELAMYILKHAHLTLKKIHGKIVRVNVK